MKLGNINTQFAAVWKEFGPTGFGNLEHEYRFAPPRRWRFDFALTDYKIAIELEGGAFTGGRHTRGKGYANDCEKYNTAQVMGWIVLRFSAANLKDPVGVIETIEKAIEFRNIE